IPIDPQPPRMVPDEHRTELVLGAHRLKLRVILELEQKREAATDPELLVQSAVDRRLHGLGAARVAAAAVRPVKRPDLLRGGSPLHQQLPTVVEDEERERTMQHAATGVAQRLAEVPDLTVAFVHQDQSLGICGNIGKGAAETRSNIVYRKMSPRRNTQATGAP